MPLASSSSSADPIRRLAELAILSLDKEMGVPEEDAGKTMEQRVEEFLLLPTDGDHFDVDNEEEENSMCKDCGGTGSGGKKDGKNIKCESCGGSGKESGG